MDKFSRIVFIMTLILPTMIISTTKGSTITTVPGADTVIQFTMDPLPTTSAVVKILYPTGDILFNALGTSVLPTKTNLGKRVIKTDNTNTKTGHIEFTLTNVTSKDAGDYKTSYIRKSDGKAITQDGVTLVVYGKPSTPSITVLSPPLVGDYMNLSCATQSNSRPENHKSLKMKYKWYINGTDLPKENRYVTSGSWLQVKDIKRSDRNNVFTCKAYETASLISDTSVGYTVVVQYGPETISPDSIQQHTLLEDKGKLGPIVCIADCSPACKYQWKFNNVDIGSSGNTLTVNNIQRTSNGTYWCVASNMHGTARSKNVTVTVLYGPKLVTISPSDRYYTRVEVSSTSLGPITCAADCNPGCSYQWFRNGLVISTSSVLTLTGITRSDNGTYFCTAYNAYREMNSIFVNLDVEYGPDVIALTPPTVTYTLFEYARMNEVICTSDCNPECSYSWEYAGNTVSQGRVLSRINNIKRNQAGKYVCKVKNKRGKRESIVTIYVHYAPDKPVLSMNSNNADVKENFPIQFQCTTQSNPPSNMTIYREDMSILNTADNTVRINHTLPQAGCLDTGTFYCSAENYVGKSASAGKKVNVLCIPRSDHRFPQQYKRVLKPGETLNISGTLISNPLPTVYWSIRRNGLYTYLTNNTDGFIYHNYQESISVTSQAVRTSMDNDDFGEYVMNAYNDYGHSTIAFSVIQIRRPDAPILLSILCKPENPVQISFAPSFDGGDTQVFVIGMRSSSDSVLKGIGDKFTHNKETVITLSGPTVDPDLQYTFSILASNKYGTTESTSYLNCSVGVIAPESQTDVFQAGVAMLVIGLLALIVAIGLVIFLQWRRIRAEQKSEYPQCGSQNPKPSSGSTYPNNIYAERKSQHYEDVGIIPENVQSIEMQLPRDGDYEGLGERPPPPVYDGLNNNPVPQERPEHIYLSFRIK